MKAAKSGNAGKSDMNTAIQAILYKAVMVHFFHDSNNFFILFKPQIFNGANSSGMAPEKAAILTKKQDLNIKSNKKE